MHHTKCIIEIQENMHHTKCIIEIHAYMHHTKCIIENHEYMYHTKCIIEIHEYMQHTKCIIEIHEYMHHTKCIIEIHEYMLPSRKTIQIINQRGRVVPKGFDTSLSQKVYRREKGIGGGDIELDLNLKYFIALTFKIGILGPQGWNLYAFKIKSSMLYSLKFKKFFY